MISRFKKLPFSSKGIVPYRLSDDVALVWLYCGSLAWNAKNNCNGSSVILPPDENPAHYDWRFTCGQTVIANVLGHADLDYRERIALYVLEAGANEILFILPRESQDFQIGSVIATELVSIHERYVRD